MEKILSQDEINALFSAMSSEDLDLEASEQGGDARKVINYDFHRADRISQDQIRSLTLLHDYFSRNLSSSLSAYLRAFVQVNLISIDQVAYAEFLKLLPDPTLFSSLGMRPMDANMALEINPSIVFPMIDILLGGTGEGLVGDRNLTEIEMNIIDAVIRLAMRDLRDAWRPVMEMELSLEGSGTKPQMFQIVSPAETVVAVCFEVKLADNSGMMNVSIPSRMLKVIRNRFDQQWNARNKRLVGSDAKKVLRLLHPARMSLRAVVSDNHFTVADLLNVSVGDTIQLNHRIDDPLSLCVNGVPKFSGSVMLKRGKRSFEIIENLGE